jgi:hypothetical protein
MNKIQKDFEYCQQYINLIKQDFKSYSNSFDHYINNFCNQAEIKKVYEIISEIYEILYITYDFIYFKNNLLNIYNNYIIVVRAYINNSKKHTKTDKEYNKLLDLYFIYDIYSNHLFYYNNECFNIVKVHYLFDIFLKLKNKNMISTKDFNNCFNQSYYIGRNLFICNDFYNDKFKEIYYIEDKNTKNI